jgi:hypothetical protein
MESCQELEKEAKILKNSQQDLENFKITPLFCPKPTGKHRNWAK